MLMTMFQTLPADNPARRLLEPQSRFLIPFDDVLLPQWSAAAPPTSIATGLQFLELIDRFAADRRFFDDDPRTQLERLGVTESDFTVSEPWDHFSVVGDLLAIWDSTARYVDTYVDHAYPGDRDVQHDRQLEKWITESGDIDGGNVRGLPAMDSKDALKRVLQSLIYRDHRARHQPPVPERQPGPHVRGQLPALPAGRDHPRPHGELRYPGAAPVPAQHRDHRIDVALLLHLLGHLRPYVPFVPLEGTDADLFFDDDVSNEALTNCARSSSTSFRPTSRVLLRSGSGNGTSSFEAEEQCDDRTYRWQ